MPTGKTNTGKKITVKTIIDWLYLPDGLSPLISRLVGLVSLPIGIIVWFYGRAGGGGNFCPQPYNVPTWRFGTYLLDPPLPPEPVSIIIFALFIAASLLLITGRWSRVLYMYMAAVLAYYTAREYQVCCWHWVLLDFLMLASLSFRSRQGEGRSPARRLIQIMIFTCYIFGVLQKLFYPDFLAGISLESYYYDGFAINGPFKYVFVDHPLPMSIWAAGSIGLLAAESSIAFALFFKRTRLAACLLGAILHGGILLSMDWIIVIFSIEMWTGYLAFFEAPSLNGSEPRLLTKLWQKVLSEPKGNWFKRQVASDQVKDEVSPGPFRPDATTTALTMTLIALMFIVPARIYFLPGPPAPLLTLFERTPWTFGMFLMRHQVAQVEITFDDAQGKTCTMPADGRIRSASNDNELITIARYVLQKNPGAKSIRINTLIIINERRKVLRTLIWDNPSTPNSAPKIAVTLAGEYCRGAANRNLHPDHQP